MKWIRKWVATVASPTHPARNEDRWWLAGSQRAAAVVDGMGGYRRKTVRGEIGGEHAAALTVEVLTAHLDEWDGQAPQHEAQAAMQRAIAAVNERIWRELNRSGRVPAHENLEGKEPDQLSVGVAVTLVALCDGGTQLLAAQHGDTHGYLSNAQGLLQLTQDQDLLRWEAMSGMLTEEQALGIGRALDHFDGVHLQEGMEEEMLRYFFDKSIFGALGIGAECPESDWSAVRLRLNDRVALLSDGAYSNMSISELATRLAWPDDPADAVIDLAQQRSVLPRFPDPNAPERAYNLRATQDDMTVLVVEVGPDSAP